MYLSFYKLNKKPFDISTDPLFLWYGEKHLEAVANLKYGLLYANGYVVLTGDVGVGKTTLVNALIESLDENVLVANINHPTLDTIEFLSLVAKTYDPSVEITNKTDFLLFFKSFLQKTYTKNKTALLIIDESHRLSRELLEEIRLLSNMEHAGDKLIHIFFVGQNELNTLLLSPECRALRQRVTLFYDLEPLSEDETKSYMTHRLKVAGVEKELFTSEAIHKIQDFTKGYPRLINIVCDRAMLTGYVKEQEKINADIVSECARELSFLDPTALKTETIEIYKFSGWEPPQTYKLVTEKEGPEKEEQKEPTIEKMHNSSKSFKNAAYQRTGSFIEKNRQRLISAGLATAIVLLAVAVGIGVNTGSSVKTEQSIQADQTILVEKKHAPDHHAELSMPQQPSDNAESASEKSMQDISSESQQLLNKETAEKVVAPKNEITPVKLVSTITASPSLGNTPPHEAKLKTQNKLPGARSAEFTPKKISKEIYPTTLELATAALERQNFKMAIELIEADRSHGTKNSPKLRELYSKALVGRADQIMKKSPSEAEAVLRKAVEANLKNIRAYFSLGKLYTRTKEYDRAIDAYQNAIVLNPNLSDAIFNLGFIYAETGMYTEAERLFARVVKLKPSYFDKALFNLAIVQEKLGKKKESLANMKKASAVRPDNQKVQVYLKQIESGAGENL